MSYLIVMRRLFWDVIYQLVIIINLSLMFLFRHLLHSYLYISLKINKNFECPLKTAISLIDIDIQNKVNSIRNFYLFTDPLLGKEAQNDGLVRSAVVRSKRAITNEKSTYDEMFSFLHLNSFTLLLP